MKAKKIISIALTITMLLMTPMQAVFAEGQQEVTEDANIEMKKAYSLLEVGYKVDVFEHLF